MDATYDDHKGVTLKPVLEKRSGESIPIPETDYTYTVRNGVVYAAYTGSLFEKGDHIIWNTYYEVTFGGESEAT